MISKFKFNTQHILINLPPHERDLLEENMYAKKYRKNQSVFTANTLPTGIFYIKTGKVKKFKVDHEGREQIIYIYNEGEFFRYSAVLSESSYSDSVVAIENSTIAFISKEAFNTILDSSATFTRLLLKSLSHEFSVLANLMAVLSQRTVRERVALSLLILEDKYTGIDKELPALITLSRTDLANMAGTVLETLARVLHDFKQEDLIQIHARKIEIMDSDRLCAVANFY
ncbi:Crp/Fnr family transcriptional regulator [Flavobacterium rakeshii]|uniref:Crp/Fnr family transcriptional regulator n=1 Tax=Flavobacterium rakeshii TaxID=1038845 RepID=UPI002E7B7104|nr:Crp/Fnr family transcriptional regulator [Flavobacterium rakeshii]MEE1896960.1 Crp/Fnr family transcriptional regulator [Flavobacterium rakeshii]